LISQPAKKLLVIGKVWPEPSSSAAGSRILHILNTYKQAGYSITFASSAGKSPFSFDLNSIGIREAEIPLNDSAFDTFVKNLHPDVVLFDRFTSEEQFGWRVAEACPNTVRVLDTEDLHCLREGRRQALKEGATFNQRFLNNEIAKREIASILRCDLSIIISEFEMNLLQTHFRIAPELLLYLPFFVPEFSDESWKTYAEREHFISIGNFLHPPNWDAVLYLKQTIWPLIRAKLPNAELHIYGAYPSQKVWQLHNEKEGFIVKGRADDALDTVSQYRVLLAPLRFGAGLKGKCLDAMCTGTPSICSGIGAEGMNGDLDWPGVIADNPEKFANAAVEVYQNHEDWKSSQSRIKPMLTERFGAAHPKNLIEKTNKLSEELGQHRSANFLGQMLMHHTMASTKFMSKWIEEKNRRTD
jgi:glycosyltransferase involved in cell wall biosynthesis